MDKNLRMIVSFAGNDRLSGTLKSIIGLGQSGSEKLAIMKKEARGLEKELADVEKELRKGPSAMAGIYDRQRQLAGAIEESNRKLEKQARLVKIAANADRMRSKGEALKSAGANNVAGGVGILAGFALAAKGAADFQAGMTDIALKANLSVRETAALQNNILGAARAARQLPEAMRSGVDVLAGFGLDPKAATRMIGPIGKVATAYRADIADLAAASFANFSNLKVPIGENARALEIMAAAGNAGAFEIKDMAAAFPALTAQAQAFGQKGVSAVADLAAAAQIARKGTGSAEQAATNLQNLLAKINTKETIQKFAAMGVDLPAALKKAYAEGKTPLEAIATIANKTLKGDLSKISFLFGDMQAQQALRPLIQNMEEYRRIRADALASKGAVDAAFARRSQDASTQAQALMGNLQRLAITAGPILLPPLIRISEILLRVTDRVALWTQRNPQAASTILTLVAGLGVLKIGLGLAQLAFGALLGPMATAYSVLMRGGPALIGLFRATRIAALFMARGVMTAGAMMLANPLVAAIVAVVAVLSFAGYMIYRHWSAIKTYFLSHWTFIRNLMLGALVIFAPFVAGTIWVAKKIYDNWGAISGAIGAAVQKTWAFVRPAVMPIVNILTTLEALKIRFWKMGWDLISGLWLGIWNRAKAVLVSVAGIAANIGATFAKSLGIHSPSRVFMAFGGHITDGLALGIDRGSAKALRSAQAMASGVAGVSFALGAPALAANAVRPANPVLEPVMRSAQMMTADATVLHMVRAMPVLASNAVRPANPVAEPVARPFVIERQPAVQALARAGSGIPVGRAPGAPVTQQFGPVSITINAAPGQSVPDIAQAVRVELERHQQRAAAARRSSYRDD